MDGKGVLGPGGAACRRSQEIPDSYSALRSHLPGLRPWVGWKPAVGRAFLLCRAVWDVGEWRQRLPVPAKAGGALSWLLERGTHWRCGAAAGCARFMSMGVSVLSGFLLGGFFPT